ncbi:hypothetical protein ACOME3_007223 [Neoechinorhynchus agilis]
MDNKSAETSTLLEDKQSNSWRPPLVTLETTLGSLVIELYWDHAPRSCRNFAELSKRNFYNGCLFHRVIRGFLIQSGDPTGTGKGGTSIYGKSFDDEIHPDLKFTGAGIIACANAGPNTNGSQFFITLSPAQHLDGKYSIFGRVQSGMGVVKKIGIVEVSENNVPMIDITILRAYPS